MANGKKDAHPSTDFNAATQRGLKALALAQTHQVELVPRLAAGTLDGLTADLQKLGADVPRALVRRSAAKTATKSQNEALAQGYLLVTAIRTSVQRRGAPADVRAAYGVGVKTSEKVVKQVAAAISLILKRAGDKPAEAADLGILQKDLAALGEDLAAITEADGAQEAHRAGAPGATKERNRTANRILAAVDMIVGAGVVEFAKDAAVRAEFEALVSGGGGGRVRGRRGRRGRRQLRLRRREMGWCRSRGRGRRKERWGCLGAGGGDHRESRGYERAGHVIPESKRMATAQRLA